MERNVKDYHAFQKGEIKMPEHLSIKKAETAPLFKNKFLERLTHTSIFSPIIMHMCISMFLLWYSFTHFDFSIGTTILLGIGGFVTWTLAEYGVHRFLYHTETNSKTLFKIQHNGHSIHHQHPMDPTRLAMPPAPGLILAGLFFLLFWSLMGHYVYAFFPGFLFGYLTYISLHYAQHRVKKPAYKPYALLWKHHAVHHFKDPYVAYGVSTRLWDFVFGTMPKKKKRRNATTAS